MPPVLTIHHERDPLVPYDQAVRLHEALNRVGAPNQLLTIPGAKHWEFSDAESLEIYAAIRAFFKKHGVLPAGGVLCVTVPNDFSPLQRAFLKVKGHLPWFVCLPDHLNYFDFDTLAATLDKTGFTVEDRAALYPLERFLLQALDYIADPALGPVAHRRRVMFEDNMKAAGMTEALDHFYRTLAAGGYGRDARMVARKR